jgi:hypothetical protein
VEHYGVGLLDRLRRREIPRFADGGLVGRGLPPASAATVVRVPVAETRTHSAPVRIERLYGLTLEEVEAEAERRGRAASLPGNLGDGG